MQAGAAQAALPAAEQATRLDALLLFGNHRQVQRAHALFVQGIDCQILGLAEQQLQGRRRRMPEAAASAAASAARVWHVSGTTAQSWPASAGSKEQSVKPASRESARQAAGHAVTARRARARLEPGRLLVCGSCIQSPVQRGPAVPVLHSAGGPRLQQLLPERRPWKGGGGGCSPCPSSILMVGLPPCPWPLCRLCAETILHAPPSLHPRCCHPP